MKSRLTVLLGAALCCFPHSPDAAELPLTLAAGGSGEYPLAAGESRQYVVALRTDDYIAVDVEERGVDITLRVLDSQGRSLCELQTSPGRGDTDRLRFIAIRADRYRLQVSANSSSDGQYRLHTRAIRSATAVDRTAVAASASFHEALKSAEGTTPEQMRRAVQEFRRSIALGRTAHEIGLAADAALLAGRLSFRLDARGQAVEYTQQALVAYREIRDVKREAKALNNLGAIYQEMARPTLAIGYFTRALAILEDTKDVTTRPMVLHNLGWYHQLLGEYATASNYYRRALPLEVDSGTRAGTLNNLGRLNASLGDFRAASDYLQQALNECNAPVDNRCKAETLVNLGSLLLSRHQVQAARDRFAAALSALEGTQNDVWRAKALLGLAAAAEEPFSAQSGDHIRTALELVRRIKDRRLEADALQQLGDSYEAGNANDLARKTYEEALELQQATGEIDGEAQSLLAIGYLLRKTGDLQHALEAVERAIDARESVREQVARPDLRSTYLAHTQEYYGLYVDILMSLHARYPRDGYDAKALQASERARARGLIDALAERRADILGRYSPQLLKRERAIRRTINAADQKLRMISDGAAGKEEAQQQLDAAVSELRELEGEIRARDPRYAELTHPRALDLDSLRRRLDSETVLLEYWLGAQHSYVWAITHLGMSSYVLPPGPAIEDATRRYFAAITARPAGVLPGLPTVGPAADEQAGRALGQILLGQLTSQLQYRRLVLVRYGALEYIPFVALPAPSATREGRHRLIEDHEIVNLPAISVLNALRTASLKSPRKTIAIFADPVFSGDDVRVVGEKERARGPPPRLAEGLMTTDRSAGESGWQTFYRLRYSRSEADAIAALIPPSERLEALDFQASRDAALSSDMKQYRYIHFATHGVLDSERPELSGLVFSTVDERGRPRDGLVRLHEIFGLQLHADLVVLSACQTALGKEIAGEGLVGLTRGFMYAGAPRVVATLWNVDDRATAELMRHFYQGLLKQHESAAVALRTAQLDLMQQPQWSSPYYWAGVLLQGAWN